MNDKLHMLVVDDDVTLRTTLSKWFSAHGFDVDVAKNGREAVDRCMSNNYNIVTMDLDMPIMGGIEAIKIIGSIRPEIPIVVLTGLTCDLKPEFYLEVAKVLSKPIRLTELSRNIEEVLEICEI